MLLNEFDVLHGKIHQGRTGQHLTVHGISVLQLYSNGLVDCRGQVHEKSNQLHAILTSSRYFDGCMYLHIWNLRCTDVEVSRQRSEFTFTEIYTSNKMATIKDHLLGIPPVTRFFTSVTLITVLFRLLHWISPMEYHFFASQFWYDLEYVLNADTWSEYVWRLLENSKTSYKFFTTFFFPVEGGPLVFMSMYSFYLYSSKLEGRTGKFKGNFPDYLWFILLCGAMLIGVEVVVNYFEEHLMFTQLSEWTGEAYYRKLQACLIYVWLRYLKSSNVDFLGIFRVRSYYLPLCHLALAVVDSRLAVWDAIVGYFVGYIYLCIQSDTLPFYNLIPRVYGKDDPRLNRTLGLATAIDFIPAIFDLGYLKAPRFLYSILGYPYNTSKRSTAFKNAPEPSVKLMDGFSSSFLNRGAENTFRGTGHRLGGASDKKND